MEDEVAFFPVLWFVICSCQMMQRKVFCLHSRSPFTFSDSQSCTAITTHHHHLQPTVKLNQHLFIAFLSLLFSLNRVRRNYRRFWIHSLLQINTYKLIRFCRVFCAAQTRTRSSETSILLEITSHPIQRPQKDFNHLQ